nr:MAG TPA: Protein of unknown function (DUF1642) [Caudoviricetes sp.]
MNKQELIEAVTELPVDASGSRPKIDKLTTLELIKLLDEPQKVRVSEEEAKFLETFNLNHRTDVTKALYYISRVGFGYCLTNNDDLELRDLSEEFWDFENRKRLIKAILDGYEVEKEKRYRISMPKARNYKNHAQILCEKDGKIFWCGEWYPFRTKFTRKELEEAGFGEVFNSTLFEVEEVE